MNLPDGWLLTTTADACVLVQSGGTPKAGFVDRPGVPFLKVYNIVEQRIDFDYRPQFVTDNVHTSALRKSRALPDDVLMNIVGPPLGKVAIVPPTFPEWNLNQALTIFRPSAAVTSRWLYFFLCGGSSVRSVVNETRGSAGQVNISLTQCRSFELLLPPLAEQRRIVAKVDSLLAKSRRARDHLDHIPRLVEKYKQALLAAAFRGDLGDHSAHDWKTTRIGEIVDKIIAGKNLRCEERPPRSNERGVVKVSAVTWGTFNPEAAKTLPTSFDPPAHTKISTGDLLISRANTLELVGAVVIVKQAPSNLYLSDKVLRIEMPTKNRPWLLWFLRSPSGRQAIEAAATGNQLSMRNLSQEAFRDIEMPWPPEEVRGKIAQQIETAFAWIDRLASEATSARKLIDRLDQAVLTKAFRGELVPQDPNDEPASVLLERIRAERDAASKVDKPKASRRRKA